MNAEPLQPETLAHHNTASSLNYKDWGAQDVQGWLEEHLKLPQYKDTFSKLVSRNDALIGSLGIDGSLLDHIQDEDL